MKIDLQGREVAIIGAALRRCLGWDDPRELQRFVNVAAEHVSQGWTDDDMNAVLEHICQSWRDQEEIKKPRSGLAIARGLDQ